MAYWYVDPDSGATIASGATGASWAQAIGNGEGLDDLFDSAVLGAGDNEFVDAGDTVFLRSSSAGDDTKAATRTLNPNGGTEDKTQSIKVIGVKAATTHEGASVVASDVAVQGETQPVFAVTGAGNDLNFTMTQPLVFVGIRFEIIDQAFPQLGNHLSFYDCTLQTANRFRASGLNIYWYNTNFEGAGAGDFIQTQGGLFEWRGGTCTGSLTTIFNTNPFLSGPGYIEGVDFSGCSATATIVASGSGRHPAIFQSCKFPSGAYNLFTAGSEQESAVIAIGCSGSGSHTTSVQDYEYEDNYGTVDASTNYRVGGADDGDTGEFSYAMTPGDNKTQEGTKCAVKSPWFRVWVAGDGSTSRTLTVFTTHDNGTSGGIDLYEDELWVEFSTVQPDGDTNNLFTPIDNAERFLVNTTAAGADDTGSTWNNAAGSPTNNTYKQKFSVTYTPDYDGFASARVWYAKRMTSSFDVAYVDPRIIIT